MADPIKPSVAAIFPAFSAEFEGRVSTMYVDTYGLVTIGIGCLIDRVQDALALPFVHGDGRPATRDEIAAAWRNVKARANPKLHWRFAIPYSNGLRLTDAGVDDLCRQRLTWAGDGLTARFPRFPYFPADAQLAMLSLAWAVGSGWPAKFPHGSAAIDAGDWAGAASACKIREAGNPGVVPRNRANRYLFLCAAAADSPTAPEGYADTVHWAPIDARTGA